MKLSEIEVGKEYVDKWGDRFKVIDKGNLARRVFSNERSDFGGHISTSPCVKVQWLNSDGTLRVRGPREHLTAAQVTSTLEEWQKLDAVRRKVERDLEDQFRSLQVQAERVTNYLEANDVKATAIARRAGMIVEITLFPDQAEALIEALGKVSA